MSSSDAGYASTYALILIGVLALVAFAAAGPQAIAGRRIRGLEDRVIRDAALQNVADEVLRALANDPTPSADSFFDPVWDLVREYDGKGVSITLEDLSTGVNLNLWDPDRLDEPSLANALGGMRTIDAIRDFRRRGVVLDKDSAGELVGEGTIGRYFSLYGFADPNITDAETLASFLSARISREEAVQRIVSDIEAARQSARIDSPILDRILGSAAGGAAVILSPVPPINVNTADRDLLGAVLSFREWGRPIDFPLEVVNSILSDRLAGEVLPADLSRRLDGLAESPWILLFFGTKTWFWRIQIDDEEGNSLEAIAVRIPERKAGDGKRYEVMERKTF